MFQERVKEGDRTAEPWLQGAMFGRAPVSEVHAAGFVCGGGGALNIAGVLQDLRLQRVQLDQRRRVLCAPLQHVQRLPCGCSRTTGQKTEQSIRNMAR